MRSRQLPNPSLGFLGICSYTHTFLPPIFSVWLNPNSMCALFLCSYYSQLSSPSPFL